jgi:Transcriptional regulator, AbiEi antitoxin/Protein of unknown function (DUF559)
VGREQQIRSTPRIENAARRIVALAEQQFGTISRAQLVRCGLAPASIARWIERGRLHRVARGVYALGHRRLCIEGELAAALLRAGPGAALSHMTSAWWRELLRHPPDRIHVCAPRRPGSFGGVRVHNPDRIERRWHRGLPVVSVTQTLIQIAPMCSFAAVRRALAQADHRGALDRVALERELARHPRGAAKLRAALDHHLPQLAETLSPLEERFLPLCERHGIPLPVPNHEINGYVVDAFWPEANLAVELDGREVHGTPAAVVEDRRRELAIRGAGVEVIRYGSEQVDYQDELVAPDLKAAIARGIARRTGSNRTVGYTTGRRAPPPPRLRRDHG